MDEIPVFDDEVGQGVHAKRSGIPTKSGEQVLKSLAMIDAIAGIPGDRLDAELIALEEAIDAPLEEAAATVSGSVLLNQIAMAKGPVE
jgi:hypothetical protein